MIIHIDGENIRNDLSIYLKVSGSYNDKLEVTIDQQVPPCDDFIEKNYYVLELPVPPGIF